MKILVNVGGSKYVMIYGARLYHTTKGSLISHYRKPYKLIEKKSSGKDRSPNKGVHSFVVINNE